MKASWCVLVVLVLAGNCRGNFVKSFAVKSIQQFKAENPNAELIEMDLYEHFDGARSYTMGARQTGEFIGAI
jgi:hypothetical protein